MALSAIKTKTNGDQLPAPPRNKLDTNPQTQEQRWAEWNAWCEAKIAEHMSNVAYEAIAQFTSERGAKLRKEVRKEIAELRRELAKSQQQVQRLQRDNDKASPLAMRMEIWDLRKELNAARKEIKELKADQSKSSNSIVGWKLDRQRFRAVPFFADGQPGAPINLRILFEEYHGKVQQLDATDPKNQK